MTMRDAEPAGRPNQRQRTRKDLLQAASRLIKQGRKPTLEEVAAEALVSRATAYRYFPRVEALLVEAPLDVVTPDPDKVLEGIPADDAVARVERVESALSGMIAANEPQLRMMLVHSLQRAVEGERAADLPARQNRRSALIEAALGPVRHQFRPAALRNLSHALALVIGTEAMIVFKDVLRLDEAEARRVKRWAIRALIDAARKPRASGAP